MTPWCCSIHQYYPLDLFWVYGLVFLYGFYRSWSVGYSTWFQPGPALWAVPIICAFNLGFEDRACISYTAFFNFVTLVPAGFAKKNLFPSMYLMYALTTSPSFRSKSSGLQGGLQGGQGHWDKGSEDLDSAIFGQTISFGWTVQSLNFKHVTSFTSLFRFQVFRIP